MNYILIIFVIFLKFSTLSSKRVKDDEVVRWVKQHGYESEAYKVETEDGYILKLQRIAPRFNRGCKIPIFLKHSAFSNSFYYVNVPNISIAFYFADAGYEVFMGNSRGSKYSTHHKKYDTESSDFWKFSYHEIGLYDISAMVDYSLRLSGSDRIFYIGHSQATTEVLALLSSRPEYNKKIIQSHLLGTIGAYTNPPRIPKMLAISYPLIKDIATHLPYVNFGPGNRLASVTNRITCTASFPLAFCHLTHYFALGGDPNSIFMPNISPAVYRSIVPTFSRRSGVQQMLHFVQTAISGRFRPFDYGPAENLRIYGAVEPPDYPLNNISSDIYLYVGDYDRVFSKKDADLLASQLPNVHYMLMNGYNHIDYIFARDAPERIYKVMHRAFEQANREYENEVNQRCINRRIILFILLCLKFNLIFSEQIGDDEVVRYVKSLGYSAKAYQVVTQDGYILRMHRIYPRTNKGCKLPVFLMHCAFTNSMYWVNTPGVAFGLYLADEGYEVFMGNVRGSKYSSAHKWLDPESIKYWHFGYHEMGIYDLPAMIDYTLELSGSDKCVYIGHSQATTTDLVFLSLRPEYNEKIAQSHLMGVAGAFAYPPPAIKQLAPLYMLVAKTAARDLPYADFRMPNQFIASISNVFCTQNIRLDMCEMVHFLLMGGNPQNVFQSNTDAQIYRTIAPALSPHTSVHLVTHMVQTIFSGKFRPYDYGALKNKQIYGSAEPPEYPLHKITSPIYIYEGQFDTLYSKKDADLVAVKLRNKKYYIIPGYNHLDYVFARDAREKLYKYIVQSADEYSRSGKSKKCKKY
ncbi:uncharacterized protein [Chironomus tepperi]|uniref:uncharacterized protein n=1 Tax=Chironomus tepperi TaxID=113505 RepID=UPI00391F1394